MTTVTGVEMFRKLQTKVKLVTTLVLYSLVLREDVVRGQVLAHKGSIKPHKKFKASVYILSKEEGGRHTPFFKGFAGSSTSELLT